MKYRKSWTFQLFRFILLLIQVLRQVIQCTGSSLLFVFNVMIFVALFYILHILVQWPNVEIRRLERVGDFFNLFGTRIPLTWFGVL